MIKKQDTKHIGVRLPENIYEVVQKRAVKEGRSFSNMIINLVQQALIKTK